MSATKIRIKVGDLEVDYEGDASFLKTDLLKLIQDLQKHTDTASGGIRTAKKNKDEAPPAHQMTTKSIATKLNAKSASDLATAALAHLVIMKGKDSATRSEILEEMKTASGHYKANMSGNHTKTLRILLNDDTVVETAKDLYALKPAAEQKLRSSLGIG